MKKVLPSAGLYVITPDALCHSEPLLLKAVQAAIRGSAVMVQYRDKINDADTRLRQAKALGRALSAEKPDAIYASDLQRAQMTAQHVADAHQMNVLLDPALRERCYGAFEGLMYEEITQRYPAEFAAWHARDLHMRFPAGERDAETLQEFHQRSVSALERIARRHAQGCIVVVTHGGVLDCVYREATGMPVEAKRDFETINAAINRLRWDGERFVLLQWADTSHLESAGLDEIDRTHPAA